MSECPYYSVSELDLIYFAHDLENDVVQGRDHSILEMIAYLPADTSTSFRYPDGFGEDSLVSFPKFLGGGRRRLILLLHAVRRRRYHEVHRIRRQLGQQVQTLSAEQDALAALRESTINPERQLVLRLR